jgi:hypothetical protein
MFSLTDLQDSQSLYPFQASIEGISPPFILDFMDYSPALIFFKMHQLYY